MQIDDRCIRGLSQLDESLRGCAMTVGNFDGVHLGHRRILSRCRELIGGDGAVVALTFDPPPEAVLRKGLLLPRIDKLEHRCRLLLDAGADRVLILNADETLLAMTPDEFVDKIVVRRLAPRHVVEGPSFRYGVGRMGNVATLRDEGSRFGFEVHVVDPVPIELHGESQTVSSTLVRRLLSTGDVECAARCLDRPFRLFGRVIHGEGRGKELGFPTANIRVSGQVIPQDGVYAGWGLLEGQKVPAAISIGSRPTLEIHSHAVEAHLVGIDRQLYDTPLQLDFLQRLRDQEIYASLDELTEQISGDIESVLRICR